MAQLYNWSWLFSATFYENIQYICIITASGLPYWVTDDDDDHNVDTDSGDQNLPLPNEFLRPITSQYSGHVICMDQSEASIQITWSVWTN